MARRSSSGKFIISAGEVGAYTVCPESWRLQTIEKVKTPSTASMEEGKRLHEKWASTYDEASYLRKQAILVILLLLITVGFVVLSVGLR
jgi:hypothetical protein